MARRYCCLLSILKKSLEKKKRRNQTGMLTQNVGRVSHKKLVKITTGKATIDGLPPYLKTSESFLHCASRRLPSWIQERILPTSNCLSWIKPRRQKERTVPF